MCSSPIEKCRNLCYNRYRSEKWKMIRRGAQAAFYRCDFPKRRSPCRTRSRGDLPRDFPFGERILAAKTARKTDDFPKRLLSPDGTRAWDDRVPTHRMLCAAWDNKQNSTVQKSTVLFSYIFCYCIILSNVFPTDSFLSTHLPVRRWRWRPRA